MNPIEQKRPYWFTLLVRELTDHLLSLIGLGIREEVRKQVLVEISEKVGERFTTAGEVSMAILKLCDEMQAQSLREEVYKGYQESFEGDKAIALFLRNFYQRHPSALEIVNRNGTAYEAAITIIEALERRLTARPD